MSNAKQTKKTNIAEEHTATLAEENFHNVVLENRHPVLVDFVDQVTGAVPKHVLVEKLQMRTRAA